MSSISAFGQQPSKNSFWTPPKQFSFAPIKRRNPWEEEEDSRRSSPNAVTALSAYGVSINSQSFDH